MISRAYQLQAPDGQGMLLGRAVDPDDPAVNVIAWPGRRIAAPLLAGDIVVQQPLGGKARNFVLPDSPVNGITMVEVAETGSPYSLQLYGPDRILRDDLTILRAGFPEQAEMFPPQPAPSRPTIRPGSRGPAVADAQARLNGVHAQRTVIGETGIDRCPLILDGVFGRNTRAATISFQRIAFPGQPQAWDGIIGPRTWAALIQANTPPLHRQVPLPDLPAPPVHQQLPIPPLPVQPIPDWPANIPEPAETVTPVQIGTNLAAITINSTTSALGLQPNAVDFNAIAFANTESKRTIFQRVAVARRQESEAEGRLAALRARVPAGTTPDTRTQRRITAAEGVVARTHAAVVTASTAMQEWLRTNGYAHNRRLREIAARRRTADRALARARRGRNQAAIQQAEQQVATLETERTTARAEVDRLVAAFVPLVDLTRNRHVLQIDGQTVRLYDHVMAYATIDWRGLEGQGAGDDRALVNTRLGQFATGDPLRILTVISRHEGTFSNVNTWDRAIVTWGFIQWTFGEGGDGSLVALLAEIKRREPQLFENRMQRYGLDVTANAAQLTRADGTVLTGGPAALAIQVDPKLTGVLSRLGLEQTVQQIQIEHAIATKITALRARRVSGHPVTIGDVVSSSYGVGVMTDRHVGNGVGAVTGKIKDTLDRFKRDNPGADLTQEVWKARAEQAVVAALVAMNARRAASFASLPQARGSFTP